MIDENPLCDYCGGEIEDENQPCPALEDGTCDPGLTDGAKESTEPPAFESEFGGDDEQLREEADRITEMKRSRAPEGFGEECPVCDEPFDEGSSGAMWSDMWNSLDVVSWVRLCTGPLPDHMYSAVEENHDYPPESVPFMYIHKDEHVPIGADDDED